MSHTIMAPTAKKPAYQRPYKSRRERREIDRRKHDEVKEHKFLIRVGLAVALLLALALGFALKGMADRERNMPESHQAKEVRL